MPDHTADYDEGEQYHFRNDIRPGDVVHDLAQMGWPRMRVIRQEAPSVADYIDSRGQDLRDYEKNALAGADLDDRVFLTTFLTDSPMNAAKTHYPIPESRIAKQDLTSQASHIGDDPDQVFHPADQAVYEFLVALLTELKTVVSVEYANDVRSAVDEVLDHPELTDAADDVSHARMRDRQDQQADTDDDQDQDQDVDDDGLGDFEDFDGDA
jgi:hypothetical protein